MSHVQVFWGGFTMRWDWSAKSVYFSDKHQHSSTLLLLATPMNHETNAEYQRKLYLLSHGVLIHATIAGGEDNRKNLNA